MEDVKKLEENVNNPIDVGLENSFLKKILNNEEYGLLSQNVIDKIENAVQASFEEFLTNKALFETSKTHHEEEINGLKQELKEKIQTIEDLISKLDFANSEIKDLRERLQDAQENVKKLQEQNKQLQYDWKDFKIQRDQAIDEKESLLQMVERRNSELSALKIDLNDMKKQLQAAIKAKMVALENADDVESLKISLNYKEKRLEQESTLLKTQLQSITEELNNKTAELIRLNKENSFKTITVEAELAEKTQQLNIAKDIISDLREGNDKLNQEVESLLEKLKEQRNSTDQMYDNFQQELQAQTRLSQLYKGLCEENDSKTEKLTNAINELQQLLKSASDQYGELETKHKAVLLQHEEEIKKKNDCIKLLKKELEDSNELLKVAKEENLETAMATLSPSAAAASRLIKSGMTLTQIYTQYASVSEQLLLEKEENRKLSLYVNTILNEIEEKAPILKQQRIDYENALANVESLTKQMDDLVAETKVLQQECSEAKKSSGFLKRENERLKKEIVDLSRQVCYLIKSVEEARGVVVTDLDRSQISFEGTESSAQHVISKKLVTFASIQDLQENNQKLLSLVRQLSAKQEASENISSSEYYDLKMKEEKLEAKINELLEDMNRQSKMLDLIKNQSLTYKKLYEQSLRGEIPEGAKPNSPIKTPGVITSTPKKTSFEEDGSEVQKLKCKLDECEKEKKDIENERNKLKSDVTKLENQLTEQTQTLKKEANDLLYKNSKLVAQAEFWEEKCKVMETNIKLCKKQIQALEERNQMLSDISAKHEQSVVHLRDEVMQLQSNLSKAEVTLENLKQENFLLKTAEARLLKEKECWTREEHSHSLLMTNLNAIKATIERSEEEGKLRLEAQLNDTLKECSALKGSLKEEKSRFKELASSLERQTAIAKERMMEEKKLADKAREELKSVQEELEAKSRMVDELHLKIRELNNMPTKTVIESVTMNLDDSTKKNKELENKVKDLEHDISCLNIQLTAAKERNVQYCEMAESLEKQLNEANENYENFRGLMTAKVEDLMRKENELKKNYEELNQKYQMASNNQKNSTEELNAKLETSSTELKSTNTELTNLRNELMSAESDLKKAKDTINSLEKTLQEVESKYSNEVVLHSSDIQQLNSVKKELFETVQQITKLKSERDNAVEALKLKASTWEEKEKKSMQELKELNQRLADLDEQNRVLHENIQELGNQIAILQCRVSDDGKKPVEDSASLNDSVELSSKAQDQLLRVIKFLRNEKDLSVTRSEILQAENTRLKTQLGIAMKELETTKESLKGVQESTVASSKASAKHAELLRKIDTLNAITDSNRILREERDKFQADLKKLKEQLEKAEAKVAPLTAEIKKLNEKVETLTNENQALTMDLAKWKQKAERSSKSTPEDWRRLTNERENLAKQWQLEKNINEKLEDELKKVKQEKTALNEQIAAIKRNLQTETNETKRLTEECNSFKQQLMKSNEALNATKAQLTKVTEESARLQKEVESLEATIKDLKTKEDKLKKLCSKYKKQYELLLKQVEEENKAKEEEKKKAKEEVGSKTAALQDEEKERIKEEGRNEMKNKLTPKLAEMETKYSEKIKELEAAVNSAQEESKSLKKDNENLKTNINEKEERVKVVMKNARTKIATLSEQKKNLELEIEQIKGQAEITRDESDSKLNTIKAHYESKISEMEKERAEHVAERDQERERLTNQIKALSQKLNQMQRLYEKQLGAKPSTSSRSPDKSPMEPPTANIKPMAGSSSSPRKEKQTTGPVGPTCWRSNNETPFASIRPTISMQARTLAVMPTSQTSSNQTSSSQSTPVMILPQQQVVHTTGNSGEAMSSSPTSSHTDYMPATSSATPTRQVVVAPPLSVGQHSGSDAQSTQEMEAEANDNEIQQQSTSQQSQSMVQQQLQTVAMVMPRVEQQATNTVTTQSNQQQSIDQSCGIAYSQANSSNTVTTTQAGLKRTRDVEGDSSTGLEGEDLSKMVPQGKRIRISVSGNQAEAFHHQVTHSEGIEVEYQVPTSSQRDQEDDNLIIIDSDEEGNTDEGDMEAGDNEHEFEEDNGGYEIGSYIRDGQEMGIANYDESSDTDEENVTDQENNEVDVVDEGNEIPNQSGSSRNEAVSEENASQSFSNASVPVASSIESGNQDQSLQQSSEATSSGPINNEGGCNKVVVSHAASSLSSQTFRSRNVPLLNRLQQAQLIIPQSYEEAGDDSIVPSTPTLFVPKRTDGFGEAVSSPQVPHQGRFTFSDPSAPTTRSGNLANAGENADDIHLDEPGTGRSVPTTPLQVSPQELPAGEAVGEVGQSSSPATHTEGEVGQSSSPASHTEGEVGQSSSPASHVEGEVGQSSSPASHVEGEVGQSSSPASHTEGEVGQSSSPACHVEGEVGQSSSPASHNEGEVGQSSSPASHIEGEESDVHLNIPDIVVTIIDDEEQCEVLPQELSESANEDELLTEKGDTSGDEPEVITLEESDEVTSEGENPVSLRAIEESREAEASEPFDSVNIKKPAIRMGGTARRSMRMGSPRRSQTRRLTPIVWNEPGSSSGPINTVGSAIPTVLRGSISQGRVPPDQPRGAFRGRTQRARKWRY